MSCLRQIYKDRLSSNHSCQNLNLCMIKLSVHLSTVCLSGSLYLCPLPTPQVSMRHTHADVVLYYTYIYVCVCVCVNIPHGCLHIIQYAHTHIHTHLDACLHAAYKNKLHIHTYMHACTHIYTCNHVSVHLSSIPPFFDKHKKKCRSVL